MIDYRGIVHSGVIVARLDRALEFYVDALGLPVNHGRPDLGYPGAWLDVGRQQIHLMELANPDPVSDRPVHAGRDRHTALAVRGLDELKRRLDRSGIPYTMSRSGRRALFCRDPDGNGLEFIEMAGQNSPDREDSQ